MHLQFHRKKGLRQLAALVAFTTLFLAAGSALCFFPPEVAQRSGVTEENQVQGRRGLISLSPSQQVNDKGGNWGQFFERYGTGFDVLTRPGSNTIYRVYGGDARVEVPRGFAGDADMAEACLGFIRENQGAFGLSVDEVKISASLHRGGIWFVNFNQVYKSFPVFGSRIAFLLSDNGEILSLTMGHFPGIDLIDPQINEGPSPPEEAIKMIETDIAGVTQDKEKKLAGARSVKTLESGLVVYPILEGKDVRFAWAWRVLIKTSYPLQKWEYLIEQGTWLILAKRELGRYLISGQIRGQVLPRYGKDTPVEVSLPNLKVLCLRNDPPLMYESLDADPGWLGTVPYGWEFGQPVFAVSAAGGPGPDKGITGATFYGYNLNGCYPLNMWAPQYLTTSTPIDCSGKKEIYLRFWRWLGVESSESDNASIEIADGASSTWWKVWTNPEEDLYDGGWKLLLYDISKWAEGRENIFLRWGMGPTNGYVSYCGWNIDDIGVYTSTSAYSDIDGNYKITGEAQKNMLSSVLEGRYFEVLNEDGADIVYTKNDVRTGAVAQNLNFTRITNYDVSTKVGTINAITDIDEINVYYHANRLVRYIQEIDPDFWSEEDDLFPIPVTVHYDREYTNSFWMPGEGIFFGEGDKLEFNNFAHFADIIYHECSHAITDSIYGQTPVTLNRGFTETGGYAAISKFTEFDAMHEAFSDYWACTITNDSQIAEGGFWIDHDYVRDLANNLNYILNYGQELYQSSLILSGAMWDVRQGLRQEIGDEGIRVADTIFHFARLAQPETYLDFLVNCLIVDQVRYNNVHKDLIKEAFGKRGISQAPAPPSSLVVTIQNQGASLLWNAASEAIGYYVYYGPNRTVRPLQDEQASSSRYMQDGGGESSSESEERTEGGSMEGGGSSSSSTQNTPSNTNTSSNTGTTPAANPSQATTASKVDAGNKTSYFLSGLDPTVTYKVQVTSYNIYGVESPPSEEALVSSSSSAAQTGTAGTGESSGLGIEEGFETNGAGLAQGVTCFISACKPR